jgi:hypothetical protein
MLRRVGRYAFVLRRMAILAYTIHPYSAKAKK